MTRFSKLSNKRVDRFLKRYELLITQEWILYSGCYFSGIFGGVGTCMGLVGIIGFVFHWFSDIPNLKSYWIVIVADMLFAVLYYQRKRVREEIAVMRSTIIEALEVDAAIVSETRDP